MRFLEWRGVVGLRAVVLSPALFALLCLVPGSFAADTGDSASCVRPLRELRASWVAIAKEQGAEACRRKESLWLAMRKCFAGHGEWLPDLREVGDCHVGLQDEAAAGAFYRKVIAAVPGLACTNDGWTCAQAAAVELRLLDCGYRWLAAGAGTAWKDFAAAILAPGHAAPDDFRLEPVVSTEEAGPAADLACRASPGFGQAYAGGRGFGVPAAILRNARRIAEEAADTRTAAERRSVRVELDAAERERARLGREGQTVRLLLRACPFPRPHPGPPGTRHYIALDLVADGEPDPAACRTARSWIARRLP